MNNRNNAKELFINLILLIVLILLLSLPAYLCYKVFILQDAPISTEPVEKESPQEDIEVKEEIPIGPHYEELTPVIEDQQAYIVVPTSIDSSIPATLVIYNHGSDTNVVQDMSIPFMQGLQSYGILFTKDNYIFAASNAHGLNWGSNASTRDTLNLIDWVKERYDIQSKVDIIGFSMGGITTTNFTTRNPELVNKVVLLAPTTRIEEWNKARADKLENIEIKIWHGSADVNIPMYNSTKYVDLMKTYGKDIEFVKLEGKTHYDVDTEYMSDILEFFNS